MYNVIITARAERDLKKLERSLKNRLVSAILALADEPRPSGCRKVQSEEGVWRIRVGRYRVGYLIDDNAQQVDVIRIAHRSEFYG